MSFNTKVVVVTGASSGIGAATAIAFSSEGARVVLVARNETNLAEVAKKCKDPLVIVADVAKDEDATRIIDETITKFGQLDVLINNAGTLIGTGGLVDGEIMKFYDIVMNVNLRAAVRLTSLASPHLIKTKGNVVNTSSIAGQITPITTNFIAYHVSKAGLDQFTKCAAVELGQHGVRVNAVSPGPLVTDIIKNSSFKHTGGTIPKFSILDRVSHPEEVAELVLFLANEKAISITGSNYVIDNGMILYRHIKI